MSTRPFCFDSFLALCLPLLLIGCDNPGETGPAGGEPSNHADAKTILDAKCATCHQPDDIGPFPLTTHEEVKAFEAAVRSSIENDTMPPWMPA